MKRKQSGRKKNIITREGGAIGMNGNWDEYWGSILGKKEMQGHPAKPSGG